MTEDMVTKSDGEMTSSDDYSAEEVTEMIQEAEQVQEANRVIRKTERAGEEHTVFIGTKPFMNYVTAVVMQFTTQSAPRVIIKTRGKFIARAVDVAEVVKSRFLRDQVKIDSIDIGSEDFKNKEGRNVRVSTMAITLVKK